MQIRKPKLSVEEQIEHLKAKGITFNIVKEQEAYSYLNENICSNLCYVYLNHARY